MEMNKRSRLESSFLVILLLQKRDRPSPPMGRYVYMLRLISRYSDAHSDRSSQSTVTRIARKLCRLSKGVRRARVMQIHRCCRIGVHLFDFIGKADKLSRSKGSSGETSGRNGETSSDNNTEKEVSDDQGDEDNRGVDKGPSILSVDQSAITGESLAVDKCTFSSRSRPHCLSPGLCRHWGYSILLDGYQAWKVLHNRHRDCEGVIRRTNCRPCHRGYRARAFPARHVEHRDYSSGAVRL